MSTAPWGTMNDWLRVEGEQRGAWLARRVQDVRAAQVSRTETLAPAIPLRTRPKARAAAPQPHTDVA